MSDAAPRPEAPAQTDAPSFEEATRRLAQIVAELESGELPLDRSLALFEEGVRLARGAEQRLDRAERRIEELLGFDAQGKPKVRDITGASGSREFGG
jgi:exodeoxyribonuclease VII small subunit